MNRKKLLEEHKRLKADIKKSPTGVNFEGKPFPIKKSEYMLALEKKLRIAKGSN